MIGWHLKAAVWPDSKIDGYPNFLEIFDNCPVAYEPPVFRSDVKSPKKSISNARDEIVDLGAITWGNAEWKISAI